MNSPQMTHHISIVIQIIMKCLQRHSHQQQQQQQQIIHL